MNEKARWRRRAFCIVGLLSLVACSPWIAGYGLRDQADKLARDAGMVKSRIPAGQFVLTTYHRISPETTRSLVVYIEGDGRAWPSRRRPPADPTPDDPVALKLAANDPAPSVIYIARPCQFLSMGALTACDSGYWADRRFSPEVVDAIGQALDTAKTIAHADTVHLIGFSGGGVVATLLSGRRSDVASLITIASPLDLGAWVAHHGLSPLDGSLDPALSSACGSTVPQVHLAGSDDDVVPAQIILDYARRCGTTPFLRAEINDGFDHQCCWLETWAQRVTALRR